MDKKETKSEVSKPEKKLKGDSGFDAHYCNGEHHMASDCMLRKKEENKEKVKYELYYAAKLEEVKA